MSDITTILDGIDSGDPVAVEQLEQQDQLAARLVKLRYFAGLTMAQAAEALGVSQRTAERNWTYAKTWLHARLSDE